MWIWNNKKVFWDQHQEWIEGREWWRVESRISVDSRDGVVKGIEWACVSIENRNNID